MASPPFRSRRIVVACGLVVAFMLVIVRLVNLQVMQSAELTGQLDNALESLSEYLEREIDTRSTIETARCWR